MTERLIIRLASQASQEIHWLIWSDSENEIIASGEIENAEQLNLLTEKALQRTVICLLPGVDIVIKQIEINGVFNRQMQQALPYLVEDDLASDVETLHFSVIAKQANLLHVAICDKQKIVMWLDWLEAAQICCRQFIPEGLALPVGEDNKWQAVQLDEQWIVRENLNLAWSCDRSMLDMIIASKFDENLIPKIESYTPSVGNQEGEWFDLPSVSAMEILAKGTFNNKINLLTGEFKAQKEGSFLLEKLRMPIIIAVTLFFMLMLNLYLENTQLQKEILLTKQHTEITYKQAFPSQRKLNYVRIKKKIKSMLVGVEGNSGSSFLLMLNELVPAFAQNPQFKPINMKFDSKKNELKILADGDDFQSFEKFKKVLPKHFSVDQGALNSGKAGVSGLLTIGIK